MKQYARVFGYFRHYKGKVVLYFLFIILSIVFSVVSVGMLAPFFDLIFKQDKGGTTKTLDNPMMESLRQLIFSQASHLDPVKVLAIICVIIIISILLKN